MLPAMFVGLLLCIQGVGAHRKGNDQEDMQRKQVQRAEAGEARAGTGAEGRIRG